MAEQHHQQGEPDHQEEDPALATGVADAALVAAVADLRLQQSIEEAVRRAVQKALETRIPAPGTTASAGQAGEYINQGGHGRV
jgi:hypothetical protein